MKTNQQKCEEAATSWCAAQMNATDIKELKKRNKRAIKTLESLKTQIDKTLGYLQSEWEY